MGRESPRHSRGHGSRMAGLQYRQREILLFLGQGNPNPISPPHPQHPHIPPNTPPQKKSKTNQITKNPPLSPHSAPAPISSPRTPLPHPYPDAKISAATATRRGQRHTRNASCQRRGGACFRSCSSRTMSLGMRRWISGRMRRGRMGGIRRVGLRLMFRGRGRVGW